MAKTDVKSKNDLKRRFIEGVKKKTADNYDLAKDNMAPHYESSMNSLAKALGKKRVRHARVKHYKSAVERVTGKDVASAAIAKADKYVDNYIDANFED